MAAASRRNSGGGTREDACTAVLAQLRDGGLRGADTPEFEAALRRHLRRMPSRYAADVESAEDVATHMQLLDAVRAAPAVRGARAGGGSVRQSFP